MLSSRHDSNQSINLVLSPRFAESRSWVLWLRRQGAEPAARAQGERLAVHKSLANFTPLSPTSPVRQPRRSKSVEGNSPPSLAPPPICHNLQTFGN